MGVTGLAVLGRYSGCVFLQIDNLYILLNDRNLGTNKNMKNIN